MAGSDILLFIVVCVSFLFLNIGLFTSEDNAPIGAALALPSGIILLTILIGVAFIDEEIKPIDVYRGNTTLQITYEDSVAVDSVVVFKKKK